MPIVPKSSQNTIKSVSGIPKTKYARNVIYAPDFYLPEARIPADATPYVVSKITKRQNINHADFICTIMLSILVKIAMKRG